MCQFSTLIGNQNVRFDLVFQPILVQETLKVMGYECLSRVENSLPGMSKEELFEKIPKEALKKLISSQVEEINKMHTDSYVFSINIPASLVIEKEFFHKIIENAKFNLAFEITTFDIASSQSSLFASRVKEAKDSFSIRFWFDDFIPNNYFLKFYNLIPWDVVKFDKSLIKNKLLLGKAFNACKKTHDNHSSIIVEGIENEQQHISLDGLRVLAQGFFYGRPGAIENRI